LSTNTPHPHPIIIAANAILIGAQHPTNDFIVSYAPSSSPFLMRWRLLDYTSGMTQPMFSWARIMIKSIKEIL
jgi:hypothetical protein